MLLASHMHVPHLQLPNSCVIQGSVLQGQLCGIMHRCAEAPQQPVKLCLQVVKVLTESRHHLSQIKVCSWCRHLHMHRHLFGVSQEIFGLCDPPVIIACRVSGPLVVICADLYDLTVAAFLLSTVCLPRAAHENKKSSCVHPPGTEGVQSHGAYMFTGKRTANPDDEAICTGLPRCDRCPVPYSCRSYFRRHSVASVRNGHSEDQFLPAAAHRAQGVHVKACARITCPTDAALAFKEA